MGTLLGTVEGDELGSLLDTSLGLFESTIVARSERLGDGMALSSELGRLLGRTDGEKSGLSEGTFVGVVEGLSVTAISLFNARGMGFSVGVGVKGTLGFIVLSFSMTTSS